MATGVGATPRSYTVGDVHVLDGLSTKQVYERLLASRAELDNKELIA